MNKVVTSSGCGTGKSSDELPEEVIAALRKTRSGRRFLAEDAEFKQMIERGFYVDPKTGEKVKVVDASDQCGIMVVIGTADSPPQRVPLLVRLVRFVNSLFGRNSRIAKRVQQKALQRHHESANRTRI